MHIWIITLFITIGCTEYNPDFRTPLTNTVQGSFSNDVGQDEKGKGVAENPVGIKAHTVAVIDDGFDVTHPVFKDKIVGEYTIQCDQESYDIKQPSTFDALKAAMIEQVKEKKSNCRLEESIQFDVIKDVEPFTRYKDTWNDGILSKTGVKLQKNILEDIHKAISGKVSGKHVHGTNVAGVIAYKNANTRFVFLQMKLLGAGEKPPVTNCPKQENIDLLTRVYEDPDYIDAHSKAPLNQLDENLRKIEEKYKITLVNMSLGRLTRAELEKNIRDNCGENINYSRLYAAEGNLKKKRAEWLAVNRPSPLQGYQVTVQAAGNSNAKIDDPSDTYDCGGKEHGHIFIGSYGLNKNKSNFSNYGDCVDYYLLGEKVIVAAPGGFLNVVDGTSFSAPLLTRYLALNTKAGSQFTEAIRLLNNNSDSRGYLSSKSYPSEIAFENKMEGIPSYALSSSGSLGSSLSDSLYFLNHNYGLMIK